MKLVKASPSFIPLKNKMSGSRLRVENKKLLITRAYAILL